MMSFPSRMRIGLLLPALFLSGLPSLATAQLRIAAWNITNWNVTNATSPRANAVKTAVFGTFQGRSMSPDVLLLTEIINLTSYQTLVTVMNTAPGSPGDYAAYTFLTGPDTQSGCIYRTSKVVPLGPPVLVSAGGGAPEPPRNTYRYDFYPIGYDDPSTVISAYNVHLKAGDGSGDKSRRLLEAQRIRLDANNLTERAGIIVCGDFNIDSSSESSYQHFLANQVDNSGRFFDPINTPGSWSGSSTYKFVHTQDPWASSPPGSGIGIDDRYDFILMDSGLLDGIGMHYVGNSNIPYSTTTWNDPNHSYRVWGNDGSSWYGGTSHMLTITGNTMVGATIAQALVDSTGGQTGHLPLFADVRVPAVAATDTATLDFGLIGPGFTFQLPIQVANIGDTGKWGGDGVADLTYSFNTTGSFFGPSGTYSDRADDGPKTHLITASTDTPGRINGTITITTNDPIHPTLTINCTALVVGTVTPPGG